MKKRWAAGILAAAALAGGIWLGRRGPVVPPPVVFPGGGGLERVVLSPDGGLLAESSRQGQVILYDTATGTQKFTLGVRTNWTAFSPDGRRLLTVVGRRPPSVPNSVVQVWDMAAGAQVTKFTVPPGASLSKADIAAVSPDLCWVVVSPPQHFGVYDIATGRLVKSLPSAASYPNVAFSPDSRFFAVGVQSGAGSLHVWNTQTWQPVPGLDGMAAKVSGIRFSPDGTRIALGLPTGLSWWDTRTGKQQGQFPLVSPGGLPRGFFRFS